VGESSERESSAQDETFAQRLRRLRTERHLSQREVEGPGVTYAYVSRLEAGVRTPSLRAIRTLARKLRVSPHYLETGDPVRPDDRREVRLSDAELALRLQGDVASVEPTFRALLGEAHEEADEFAALRARIGLGLALSSRGEYQEAVGYLERATESPAVAPTVRPDVYSALGGCYSAIGQGRKAIELFTDSLAAIPADDLPLQARFTAYLSSALADAGELDEARDVAASLSQRAELNTRGRAMLLWAQARAESMGGDTVAAIALMRRALGLLDTSDDALGVARAHLLCAEILLLHERTDEAEPHLRGAERLFQLGASTSDIGALRVEQANLAVQRGDADEAVSLARRAIEDRPEHPIHQGSAYRALGMALALRGETAAAIESYERAAALLETSGEYKALANTYRAWARTLEKAGRQAEAVEKMEQAAIIGARQVARVR
jgi:tetratricopeptide (TPR) repeat protein